MRKHYDFSQAVRNPYARQLKKQVTIRLDVGTLEYFKGMSGETGVPYQTLINLYLQNCASTGKRLSMRWSAAPSAPPVRRAPARRPQV